MGEVPLDPAAFPGIIHTSVDADGIVMPEVLDLLKAGRTVSQVAHDLQISDQTIYTWRRQSLVDAGQEFQRLHQTREISSRSAIVNILRTTGNPSPPTTKITCYDRLNSP